MTSVCLWFGVSFSSGGSTLSTTPHASDWLLSSYSTDDDLSSPGYCIAMHKAPPGLLPHLLLEY